jgi:hypothetical protein
MNHEATRSTMERLADSYDGMADKLERRLVEQEQQRATNAADSRR